MDDAHFSCSTHMGTVITLLFGYSNDSNSIIHVLDVVFQIESIFSGQQQIYDTGFASMEKSHQRVLREMRAAHKRELETLRTEKDQLLIEETKATQAGKC